MKSIARIEELERKVERLEKAITKLNRKLKELQDYDPLTPSQREAIALNERFG